MPPMWKFAAGGSACRGAEGQGARARVRLGVMSLPIGPGYAGTRGREGACAGRCREACFAQAVIGGSDDGGSSACG